MRWRLGPASVLLSALFALACEPAVAPEASPSDGWSSADYDAGIAAAYLTQGVQDLYLTVPLVGGRSGLLRVFLQAREPGLPAPPVRARLVETATDTVLRTWIATSPLAVLPTGLFEAARGGSWNVEIPLADILPGRHLEVEIDPVPGIAPDRLRTALRLPATGSLDVRVVPPLAVTLVPIIQAGHVPDVDVGRSAESWLSLTAAAYPLAATDLVVAPPYVTDVVLHPDGTGWSALLAELDGLRAAGDPARHYVGVVRTSGAGIAGRSLVGGLSALVSDDADYYPRITAHELGHNFGLGHAPCGVADADSLDPDWPEESAYAGARTGAFGWDPRTSEIRDPAESYDLMSYCGDAASTWISDVFYEEALAALESGSLAPSALPGAPSEAGDELPFAAGNR